MRKVLSQTMLSIVRQTALEKYEKMNFQQYNKLLTVFKSSQAFTTFYFFIESVTIYESETNSFHNEK